MVAIQTINSSPSVVSALTRASARTGVDFDYLLRTAQRESGLKTQAKAKTSSAAGLFQFIEQTWLELARKYGAEAGMGSLSDNISINAKGRHFVSDPAVKQEILALRHDASMSAYMAGKMTQDSKVRLEKALGRTLNENELYTAHFLGVRGAVKLLQAADNTPTSSAPELFPAAAKANKRLFYDASGAPKSVAQLYQTLTGISLNTGPPKQPVTDVTVPSLSFPVALNGERSAPLHPSLRQFTQERGPSLALYKEPARPSLPAHRLDLDGVFDSRLLLSAPVLDILSALDMKPKGTVTAYQRK